MTALEQLYALKIPEVQKIFLEVVQNIVDRAVLKEMEEAIENNDLEALYKASGFSPALLNSILDKIDEVYKSAALVTAEGWPKALGFVFNMRNPLAENDLKNYSSVFVTRISEEVRENLRTILSEGLQKGYNPRQTALDIVGRVNSTTKKRTGGLIGLSTNQIKWYQNAKSYLENLDEKYFTLGLRDKRFDSIVKKAIEDKKPLSKEKINQLLSAYNNRALKYRADSISRTETMQALNRGETAAINQALEEKLFEEKDVKKWWDDTGDGRTRLSHTYLGKKYNRENAIAFKDPFVTVSGDMLMYPGDTSMGADASEIVHCRCKVQYEVDFLAKYERENGQV